MDNYPHCKPLHKLSGVVGCHYRTCPAVTFIFNMVPLLRFDKIIVLQYFTESTHWSHYYPVLKSLASSLKIEVLNNEILLVIYSLFYLHKRQPDWIFIYLDKDGAKVNTVNYSFIWHWQGYHNVIVWRFYKGALGGSWYRLRHVRRNALETWCFANLHKGATVAWGSIRWTSGTQAQTYGERHDRGCWK